METKYTGLQRVEQGNGSVAVCSTGGYRLTLPPVKSGYSNAQLDDYAGMSRRAFKWRVNANREVVLTLRARFESDSTSPPVGFDGTAGFGLWNAPFGGGGRWPALPTALWFFFGGPSCQMAFAQGTAGRGWKVGCLHAARPAAYALLPAMPLGMLLMHSAALRRKFLPWAERFLGISEKSLPEKMMGEWHTYQIRWGADAVEFRIDNKTVHFSLFTISGPLGVVIWVDNQYLVATPTGTLRWGVAKTEHQQMLAIDSVTIHAS